MPAIAFPSRVFQAARSRHSYNGYLRVSEFDFTLPPELIAQYPLAERSASRMLVLDRQEANLEDSHVHQLPQWIRNGDCLVVNNSRVLLLVFMGKEFCLQVIPRAVQLSSCCSNPSASTPCAGRLLSNRAASCLAVRWLTQTESEFAS